MRKAHPEAWRSRSGPYVATLRGLRELWDLNRLTDTEGERLTEAWEHELRSSLKGIDDLDALETATGDYMLRHPRPVLQGRPFPEGPTEFGLLDRAILTQTEGAFVGLSTQVQHLRELLFEFEVRAELTPPASPGLRRAYAVDVLRQIAYVANCAERVRYVASHSNPSRSTRLPLSWARISHASGDCSRFPPRPNDERVPSDDPDTHERPGGPLERLGDRLRNRDRDAVGPDPIAPLL